MSITTGHLFAGGGGGILASEILGHQSILAIEENEYRCNILRERKSEGWFPELAIHCADVRSFDFEPWAGRVDCLAAGFPCQDISSAGSGKGIAGQKSSLVWEVFRAIDVIHPGLVFLENSPHIRTRGRREIIATLVEKGYSWRDGTLKATDVGAPHKRNRWWLLAANLDGLRKLQSERDNHESRRRIGDQAENIADIDERGCQARRQPGSQAQERITEIVPYPQDPADSMRIRLQIALQQGGLSEAEAVTIQAAAGYTGAFHWSPPDLGVLRVVDGMASRVDRVSAAGDGQVPLQAALAWLILSRP